MMAVNDEGKKASKVFVVVANLVAAGKRAS